MHFGDVVSADDLLAAWRIRETVQQAAGA